MQIRRFEPNDTDAIVELCRAEGWESYAADTQRTCRALGGEGVITLVVIEHGEICGFAQLLTDGAIRAYLANILVATSMRNRGVGKQLIDELFARANPVYIDLLSTDGANRFYDALPHRQLQGYRLYRTERT